MKKFTPSDTQLKDALGHINYEIVQLTMTLVLEVKPALKNALVEQQLIDPLYYALLESRLIHVRTLLDFFQNKKRSTKKGNELDDVLSIDFDFPAQKVNIPCEYKERLNKDLVHLTYSRSKITPEDKPWPNDQVILPILKLSVNFAEHLIQNYLPENYPEKMDEWKDLAIQLKTFCNNTV